MLYFTKFTAMFLFRILWNFIKSPYLSVVSAYRYTKNHCRRSFPQNKRNESPNSPLFIDPYGNVHGPKKRHRRGHRGGKKHRKNHHHNH